MIRPPEQTKTSAATLANAVFAETSPVHLAEMLSGSGLSGNEPQKAKLPVSSEAPERVRVGIWESRQENGNIRFVRTHEESPHHWANVESIPAKSHRPRVLLLGESVARGHFYDPGFSFAAALRSVLDFAGAQEIEIVDLARTSLTYSGLRQLLHESLALQPDAYIVFAGNNWGFSFESPLQQFAKIVREGGQISDLKTYCEESLIDATRSMVQTIANVARNIRVPCLLVVPEFNLKDWHNERSWETPFMGSQERAEWESAQKRARRAIAGDRLAQAERLAKRMIALDDGTTPAPYEILAEIALLQGDLERSRSCLESARDAGMFLPIMRTPRCYRLVQENLRKEGDLQQLTVVDLRERFREYLRGGLPDRHLFLNYCHLTLEGLRITAALVVESLLSALKRPSPSWTCLRKTPFDIGSRTSSEASFLAAFQNCVWGQPLEIVEFHLREAIRLDRTICNTITRFLTGLLRPAPLMLCSELVPIVEYGTALTKYFFIAAPLFGEKSWTFRLINSLISVLQPHVPNLQSIVDRLLLEEHAATAVPVNLLQRYYCSNSLDDQDWLHPHGYYRAYNRKSVFRVIRGAGRILRLSCVARIPGRHDKPRKARVCINDRWNFSFYLTDHWQKFQFIVPDEALVEGLNIITITWPPVSWTREERLNYLTSQWEHGRVPEITQAHGHIHSFLADVPESGLASSQAAKPTAWPNQG